jgi:hypothetical protein
VRQPPGTKVCITRDGDAREGPARRGKFLAPPGLSFRLYLDVPAGGSVEMYRYELGQLPEGLAEDCGEEPDIRRRGEVWAELKLVQPRSHALPGKV